MKFTDFVDIKSNLSDFNPDWLISVCKRENNSKRDFIFVNRIQGKHVPARPQEILHLFENLRVTITKDNRWDKKEKVCVIGFAETATAISHYIADNIPNKDCYYLQTTREKSDEPLLVEFKEEHSHATEQALYGDLQKLKNCDRILFIDDELSTGKTILNFIEELDKIGNFKYSVASFLNLQSKENQRKFEEKNIDTYALIRGEIKDINRKIDIEVLPDIKKLSTITNEYYHPKRNLVIGSEENMYNGILKASNLEKGDRNKEEYYFQASTRSPICPSEAEDYVLFNRVRFVSAKENNRRVYLYNLQQYDRIIVMANQSEEQIGNQFASQVYKIIRPLCNQLFIIPYGKEK